jgi:plastocyanin
MVTASKVRWSVLVVLSAALPLAACGGTEGDQAAEATPPAEAPAAEGGGATTVTAEETEFVIALSESSFEPGSYTLVVENAGTVEHALAISGPGVEAETEAVAPGDAAELTFTLEEGTYELWCPVDGHRDQGMALAVDVGGAGVQPAETQPSGGYGGY